jgi:hypothetical protein
MHDWYGVRNKTCPQFCDVSSNAGVVVLGETNWGEFHTIGQLYIPGSEENNFKGSATTYFDGNITSAVVKWIGQGDGPPPPSGDAAFSIFDKQNIVIILGTGIGVPLKVKWVHVWQPAGLLPSGAKP